MFAYITAKLISFGQTNVSKTFALLNNNYVRRNMSQKDIREIFLKSVEAVRSQKLIENEVTVHQSTLTVRGRTYSLERPCYVVGFGKAVLGMATQLERVLGDRLQRGVVAVPVGIFEKFERPVGSKMEFVEGARNNLPDAVAARGANMIRDLAASLTEEDLLIVLISGGGSALLPLPIPPITLEEKHNLIKTLAQKGATINELNTVRKRLSLLKGGGLAELTHPCRIVALVLSDIVGDPLDLIASGPTMPDPDAATGRALEVLKKYRMEEEFPSAVKVAQEKKGVDRGAKVSNGEYEHVRTYVIGNNRIAALAAKQEATNRGFQSVVVSTQIEGDVCEIGRIYAALAREFASVISDASNRDNLKLFLETSLVEQLRVERTFIREVLDSDYSRGICLIFAGEPTVVVTGCGKGGRNQQLALTVSVELGKIGIGSADVSFLSCGTDGIDGPTDAAGAIATSGASGDAEAEAYLENNDAYGFYASRNGGEDLVKIGHTGTNVMDIHIMMIVPKK